MRGVDLTPAQLEAAKEFIEGRAMPKQKIPGDQVLIAREDLIRLVAWYGAIRYQAAQRGIGTLESPNLTHSPVASRERP